MKSILSSLKDSLVSLSPQVLARQKPLNTPPSPSLVQALGEIFRGISGDWISVFI